MRRYQKTHDHFWEFGNKLTKERLKEFKN